MPNKISITKSSKNVYDYTDDNILLKNSYKGPHTTKNGKSTLVNKGPRFGTLYTQKHKHLH